MTYEEAKEKYLEGKSASSYKSRIKKLSEYEEYIGITLLKFEYDDAIEFIKSLNCSTATSVKSAVGTYSSFCNFLIDNGFNCVNHFVAMNPSIREGLVSSNARSQRIVLPTEFDEMIERIPNAIDKIVLYLAREGFSTKEIVELKVDDIDFARKTIKRSREIYGDIKEHIVQVDDGIVELCMESIENNSYFVVEQNSGLVEKRLVQSNYIIRPIRTLKTKDMLHMTINSMQYRMRQILLWYCGVEKEGVDIKSIATGEILYRLYCAEQEGNDAFERELDYIADKYYYADLRPWHRTKIKWEIRTQLYEPNKDLLEQQIKG